MRDPLVFDRNRQDIQVVRQLKKKIESGQLTPEEQAVWDSGRASLNATQLNRVEEWTQYLAQQLRNAGYIINVSATETTWSDGDLIYQADIDRIRHNVTALRDGYFAIPEWREILDGKKLGMEQSNALEWDLQQCYNWLQAMQSVFMYSGQANTACGLNWYFT